MKLFELKEIFKNYTDRIYIVGGYVRDKLLNIKSNDIDIEVYGIDIDTFHKIMENIGAKGVGKSFFVYKYNNIDISLPRVETKVAIGHNGFKVELTDSEIIGAKRRDFTINAMMLNIFNNEILDFFNGKKDLELKLIRMVDKIKFAEDSLRVFRAVRFASKLNFRIEKKTLSIIKKIDINDLSIDRISEELIKISNSKYLEIAFYYFIKTDLLLKLFNIKIDFKQFL